MGNATPYYTYTVLWRRDQLVKLRVSELRTSLTKTPAGLSHSRRR